MDSMQDEDGVLECNDLNLDLFHIRLKLFRKTDAAIICLFDSKECSSVSNISYHHPSTGFDINVEHKFFARDSLVKPWALNPTEQAATITAKLSNSTIRLAAFPVAKRETPQCEIGSIVVMSMKKSPFSNSFRKFISRAEEALHGVKLLHILSELKGP